MTQSKAKKSTAVNPRAEAGRNKLAESATGGIQPADIDAIAKMERVNPAIVKATALAVGDDRAKLVAAIRANKA